MVKRTVSDLQKGESALVASFNDVTCACKLLTLGLLPQMKITMVRKSPFGDALYLRLDNQLIAVRRQEAATILLEN